MRLGIFLVAAIVLTVFAILASAGSSGLLFGTAAVVWFYGAFLALLVDFAVGHFGFSEGRWGSRNQ